MDVIHAIILGIIEGITEFLPISSTGHLIVTSDLMGIDKNDATHAFHVIIQLSAILAVVANFKERFTFKHINLWLKILISFLPIAIIGLIFSDSIKQLFSVTVVAIMFIIGGIVFLVVEYLQKDSIKTTLELDDITFKQAAYIGIAQVFALIPGTSRAGSTIIGALLVGLSRKASAEFSFLLALPVLAAASGLDLLKHHEEFVGDSLITLLIGFIVSFIVAYFTMKYFIKYLEKFTFVGFGIYRILFGLVLLYLVSIGTVS